MAMTMESVVRLKQALLNIKATADRDHKFVETLVKHIPTKLQFEAMEVLVPELKKIQELSERLTSEKKPTIHHVIVMMIMLQGISDKPNSPMAQNFIDLFKEYLNSRVPNCGRHNPVWATGAFLHPKYKGAVLHFVNPVTGVVSREVVDETKERIIEKVNEIQAREQDVATSGSDNTPPSQTQSQTQTQPSLLDQRLSDSQWQALDKYFEETNLLSFGEPTTDEPAANTISTQIEVYLNTLPKMADPDGDVLAYWKTHSDTVPDLARFARSVLCIPASSASSERMFSLAGRTITDQRTSISSARAEQLIYIHQNFDRAVPHITTWDLGPVENPRGKKTTPSQEEGPVAGGSKSADTLSPSEMAALEAEEEALDKDDCDWNHSDVDVDIEDDDADDEEDNE